MVSGSTVLTLLGFCASVLFIFFVCSRLVCALTRRLRRRRRRPSPPLPRFPPVAVRAGYSSRFPADRQGHTAGGGGLHPAAVAAFPTRAFSAGSPRGEAADASAMCVVCLAEYEDNEVLRVLPYCGHDFHVACIDIWLKQHSTCPVCRVSLLDNPGSKHAVPPRPTEVIVIPRCSHIISGSNSCHCLLCPMEHLPRTSPEVLTVEPAQANQIQVVCHPSRDPGNNLTPSEVSSPDETNNQTLKLNIESTRVVGIP